MDALGDRLLHRHARVFVQVAAVAAVVVVLGTAVRKYQQQPAAALDAFEAGRGVAYRSSHARSEAPGHAADLAADVLRQGLIEILDGVVAHVVAVLRAEAGDRVRIADLLHALR